MLRARLVRAAVGTLAVALTVGCSLPSADVTEEQGEIAVVPATVLKTPTPAEDPPAVAYLPGPTTAPGIEHGEE